MHLAGSGRGGPVVDDTDDLIDGERDDAEHEMAFDLECAADAEKSGAELVFETGVDAFGHGAEIVDQVVEVGPVDELQALDFAAPFGLGLVVGAKVAVDDRSVAQRPALVVDRGGVVRLLGGSRPRARGVPIRRPHRSSDPLVIARRQCWRKAKEPCRVPAGLRLLRWLRAARGGKAANRLGLYAEAIGRYLGGTAPFGFRVGESGELVPHEAEQEAIREIMALRAQGKALRVITEAVAAKGP